MNKNLLIGIITILLVGIGFFALTKQNSQPSPSVITEQKVTTDTSNWTVYTNKTYSYSIKFPKNYEVQLGNEEQNTCIRPNVGSPCKVFINTYPNKDNLSLKDYLSKQSIAFLIDGPLIPYNFNGYDSIFNKNQLGTNLFTKRDLTVFHFVASEASSDKEIGDIVATFKFANDSISTNYISAMSILQNLPEIRLLQNDIKRLGRTTFFKAGEENGDVVKIWFYEDGFPDNHTTRIDTFNVNIKTKVITVDDVAMMSGKEFITLDDWKKTVKGRFQ